MEKKDPQKASDIFEKVIKATVSVGLKPARKKKINELFLLCYEVDIKGKDKNWIMKCWVDAKTQAEAEKIVAVQEWPNIWQISNLISVELVSLKDYKNDNPEKEHFDFALKSGFRCHLKATTTNR